RGLVLQVQVGDSGALNGSRGTSNGVQGNSRHGGTSSRRTACTGVINVGYTTAFYGNGGQAGANYTNRTGAGSAGYNGYSLTTSDINLVVASDSKRYVGRVASLDVATASSTSTSRNQGCAGQAGHARDVKLRTTFGTESTV